MNELLKELAKLAGAGVEYLGALKAESAARVVREDEWQKHCFETDLNNNGKPTAAASPGSAELPTGTPKKARRTKEQIAADEAAAQLKASEEAAAKLKTETTGEADHKHPADSAPAPQQPAPAAQQPASNPLGDFGPVVPAPATLTLPQQIAAAQAQTAAIQQPAAQAPDPAAQPAAPKAMTEEESKVNLARSVAIYVKVTAGTGATEEKLDATRNVFRSYMTTTLKAAKVKDLTHDQRLAAIAWLDAETAKVGK